MGIKKTRMFKIVCLKTLRFYQKFLSPLKPLFVDIIPHVQNTPFGNFKKEIVFLHFFQVFLEF